jgi:hypothetical protein
MSATVEEPTTVRELTRYVEHHTVLRTSYNARREQLVVVGKPGEQPPIGLWEILGSSDFEMQTVTADSRGRWLGVINASEDGGQHD